MNTEREVKANDEKRIVQTSFRVPVVLLDRLNAEAARRDIGRNRLIVLLIAKNLTAWEETELP